MERGRRSGERPACRSRVKGSSLLPCRGCHKRRGVGVEAGRWEGLANERAGGRGRTGYTGRSGGKKAAEKETVRRRGEVGGAAGDAAAGKKAPEKETVRRRGEAGGAAGDVAAGKKAAEKETGWSAEGRAKSGLNLKQHVLFAFLSQYSLGLEHLQCDRPPIKLMGCLLSISSLALRLLQRLPTNPKATKEVIQVIASVRKWQFLSSF
ncbi:hypothetical protein NDU88_005413 [Pleurodeles waltl]|uniref:Uncharacterized protein n=1 Tax=Pleurodeles waltl TaxID=8319 RepID=A0AAV7MXY9_PLEWA|nr:hypothetical protein NDU88_005413 [Pleurodeles waltl]